MYFTFDFVIRLNLLKHVSNPTEKTVSIHAVHFVSIKHVIHLTEPVWRHAEQNILMKSVVQVNLHAKKRIGIVTFCPTKIETQMI